jgi:hypothetical protein
MKIVRVYADERGETHFGEVNLELADAGPIGLLSRPVTAKSVIFRKNHRDYDYDWHTAPQRQLIVLLDGAIELEVSDGSRRTLRGGDILLMEDVTGRGHRTRNVEPCERRSLFVILDEGALVD